MHKTFKNLNFKIEKIECQIRLLVKQYDQKFTKGIFFTKGML